MSELSSHVRLYNFVRNSGANEDELESFIANVSTDSASPEKVIELVNQLHEISKSIPFDQVTGYIKEKLEEKEKIEEAIKETDAVLQSKNVSIETINAYVK